MAVAVCALTLSLLTGCQDHAPEKQVQPFQVTWSVSTNTIFVGDPVDATLILTHPTGTVVEAPTPGMEQKIVLLDRDQRTEEFGPAHIRDVFRYRLTSLRTGIFSVVEGPIRVLQDGEEIWTTNTLGPALTVASARTAGESMQDIRGPAGWPSSLPRWLWALGLVALLGILAALLAKRFLRPAQREAPAPPPEPPHVVALRRLKQLQNKQYIEDHEVEPFYVELSDIVRHYLEDRFHLRAPESTTEEFIREAVHSKQLAEAHQKLTAEFLEQSDLVKFARHEPQPEDMRAALDAASRLVHETTPAEPQTGPSTEEVSA